MLVVSMLSLVLAAPPPGPTVPVAQTLRELHAIESAAWLAAVDERRVKLREQTAKAPSDPMLRLYLAWCDFPSDETWNQLKATAQQYPDHPWIQWGMGRIYVKWKMKDQALAAFNGILKRDAGFFPAVTGLGEVALQAQDAAGAEAKFRESLKLGEDPAAHAGLGLALLQQGKKDEGRTELEKAMAAWPEQPAVLEALSALYAEAKDLQGAVTVAQKRCELAPKDRSARTTLANLRFELGQKSEAAQEYERLLRLGNPEPALVERLAGLYRELKNAEGEERTLNVLAGLQKSNPAPSLRMAQLSEELEKLEAAEGHLLEAIARDDANAQAHLALARLREKKGVQVEAIEEYRKAAAAGAPDAAAAADAIEASFKLAKRPAKGSVDAIYNSVAYSLNKLAQERRAVSPKLEGKLKLRVRVDSGGVVKGVDVLEDTVKDPMLLGHAWGSLRNASYPKQKREPIFEFELTKGK